MASWAYRATPSGTGFAETLRLLTVRGFLWRPLFKKAAQRSKSGLPPIYNHLAAIKQGDELWVYFSNNGNHQILGAYVVARRRPLADPAGRGAVVRVEPDDQLAAELANAGYKHDSWLNCFTGFDLSPLMTVARPPSVPKFTGSYAIGTFGTAPVREQSKVSPVALVPTQGSPVSPVSNGHCWGIDWSGAGSAGDKIWVAELDAASQAVVSVTRPWEGQGAEESVRAVAAWIGKLQNAWVAFDFPFGLAAEDRRALLKNDATRVRAWASEVARLFPTVESFIDEVRKHGLIGKHRRATDAGAPFAPLLLQLIYQTYWGHRLLALLPDHGTAILPWEWQRGSTVRILETCPALVLRSIEESNVGYKLKPDSYSRRQHLVSAIRKKLQWKISSEIEGVIVKDDEGDALDAVLAAIASWRASAINHQHVLSLEGRAEEGHVYA